MPFPYTFAFTFGDDSAYSRQLKQLLPPGKLWNLESDSWLSNLLVAIGEELSRVAERAASLMEESDPRTALEMLEDWERMLGLPDHCIESIPASLAERRLAITQKLIRQGGQHAAFYVALAAACGYTATVVDTYGSTVLRSGFLSGSPCYGEPWAHAWRLDVDPPVGAALSHAELECIIRRAAPSHSVVFFNYA